MRVRILKPIATAFGTFQAGEVKEIPNDIAKSWLKKGLAMKEKSLDGGKEIKNE
jgi:hypothetical protein